MGLELILRKVGFKYENQTIIRIYSEATSEEKANDLISVIELLIKDITN